jgi:hypothetical protein
VSWQQAGFAGLFLRIPGLSKPSLQNCGFTQAVKVGTLFSCGPARAEKVRILAGLTVFLAHAGRLWQNGIERWCA